jgi:uncharacterized protein YecE (DUF72 family)
VGSGQCAVRSVGSRDFVCNCKVAYWLKRTIGFFIKLRTDNLSAHCPLRTAHLITMNQTNTNQWFIGCSGFHYKEWKKVFYPEGLPQRKWFDYYSEKFNSLELNTSFYRFPQVKFLKNWYDKSPAGFCFSVKVPRAITHYKQFNDTARMLGDFYNTCREGLAEKLGCILFQLPSRMVYKKETLDKIIAAVDLSFNNVIEFRHESWWTSSVFQTLKEHQLSFCSMSHPSLPDEVIDSTVIYYRFHGVPKLYSSQYKKAKVFSIIDQANALIKAGASRSAFIYFNNTMAMGGIRNAQHANAYLSQLTA